MSFLGRLAVRVLALVLATASLASAQTLADIARKEEERRKNIKQPAKVIKTEDVKSARAPERPPAPPPTAATAPEAKSAEQTPASPTAAAAAGQAKPAEASPAEKKDETYWRNRITTARQALDRARVYADAMQTRINALTSDFASRDDPAQRAVIGQDRQRALAELDGLKKQIEQLTKDIAAIEEEARRAGAPPGWLR